MKFIDFSNDGYTRQNRKKSRANVNLKNTGDAAGRYREVADIVLNRKKATHYFDDCVIEDTISLKGDDWTYEQHKQVDAIPTEADFRKTVADYLAWKVSTLLKSEGTPDFAFMESFITAQQKLAIRDVVLWKDKIISETRKITNV